MKPADHKPWPALARADGADPASGLTVQEIADQLEQGDHGQISQEALVRSSAEHWPGWLALCRCVAKLRADPHRDEWKHHALLERLLHGHYGFTDLAPGINPSPAMQRCAGLALRALSPQDAPAWARPVNLADDLLIDAYLADTPLPLRLAEATRALSMPVLLVEERWTARPGERVRRGVVGTLTLRRVPVGTRQADASRFVRAPASSLLQLDPCPEGELWEGPFHQAMTAAEAALRRHLDPAARVSADALVWDFTPRLRADGTAGRLLSMTGPSAGAILALAAMGLFLPEMAVEFRAALSLFDWDRTAVSAALAVPDKPDNDALMHVGGLPDKLQAWLEEKVGPYQPHCLHLALGQDQGQYGKEVARHATLLDLARAVAADTGGRLGPKQTLLHKELLRHDPEAPQ